MENMCAAVTPVMATCSLRLIIKGANRILMQDSPNSLLFLQAAVINPLYLNTDFFVETVEHFVGCHAAGTMGGVAVFVRIKTHTARLLGLVLRDAPSRFQDMPL